MQNSSPKAPFRFGFPRRFSASSRHTSGDAQVRRRLRRFCLKNFSQRKGLILCAPQRLTPPHFGVFPLRKRLYAERSSPHIFAAQTAPASQAPTLPGSTETSHAVFTQEWRISSKPLSFLKTCRNNQQCAHWLFFANNETLTRKRHRQKVPQLAPKRCIRCFLQKSACFPVLNTNQKLRISRDIPAYCACCYAGALETAFSQCFH